MDSPFSRPTRTERISNLPEAPPAATELRPDRQGIDRHKTWAAYLDDAGVTATRTFAQFAATCPEQIEAKRRAEEYAVTFNDRFDHGEGAVFYGTVGTGKDHLAGAIGRRAVYLGFGVRWFHAGEWFVRVRDAMSEGRQWELVDDLAKPEVLVLSEVARPFDVLTPMQAECLLVALDKRVRYGRLTIATLNASTDEAAANQIGAAAWERLIDRAWKFSCQWESYREPAYVVRSIGDGGST